MRALVLCLFVTMSGCATAGLVTAPPDEYRVDVTTAVRFVSDPDAECRRVGFKAPPKLITKIEACTTDAGLMVLPNPCKWPGFDRYARLACHETGHRAGWTH